jgi:hypothetical protein
LSVVNKSTRAFIEERAGFRCAYCHLPMRGQVATFPIDHVVPRCHEGATESANLALACPHCNARKWVHDYGTDPTTGLSVPLFNPRTGRWAEHFRWAAANEVWLEGVTPCGRATVDRLEMNESTLLEIRRLLVTLGMFPLPLG